MSARAPSPAPDGLDRAGRLSLLGIVAAAIAATVAMSPAPPAAGENLGILALGAAFVALLVLGGERMADAAAPLRALYFAAGLGLAALIFALQARLGSFGMAWLLLMPLLVQGTFVWGWAGVAALAAATVLLPAVHVLRLAGPAAALEVAVGVGAATVFVLLFSAANRRERHARRESERLSGELAAANRRLAELAIESEELATARERNRLAREIHDSVGHGLTVGHVQIQAARVHLGRDPARALPALDAAAAAVRQGLDELRRSVRALRATPLAGRSLGEALEALRRGAAAEGPAVTLRLLGDATGLEPDAALTLYRVAQEGLTNVRKHSAARSVEIVLDCRGDRVALTVSDDGIGHAEPAAPGFGLLGLRERLALQGGALEAAALPEGGFRLRAEIG